MHIEAVYEHGVLRPTKPLNLLEGERVELALIASSEIEARRLAKAERDAREIEIINQNIPEY
jgi:predicted DNA-binding antitoxin AbrB/MazE fold protein